MFSRAKGTRGMEIYLVLGGAKLGQTFYVEGLQRSITTKTNLFKRKVVEDTKCPCCTLEEETTYHVLWSCPAARDVWGSHLSAFQKCYCEGD
jgi:hypothetical protein